MYAVYVLKSIFRNYIYVGLTNCLDRRIAEHQRGKEKTTAPYSPFKFIYSENFSDRLSARKREKYLKSGIGKEWIKNNLL